jgi:hypothetical protein
MYSNPQLWLRETDFSLVIDDNKILKGQSHEKVGEMRVEGDSLGPN